MKRIVRKELIDDLEYLRMGFRTAYDHVAKSVVSRFSMRAFHHFANSVVEKYGGEKVADIEEPKRKPRKGGE